MIEIQHLYAGYQKKTVIRDVSIQFKPGEVLVLLGPNGCGKSTLIRSTLGLQPHLGGRVLFDGADAGSLTPRQIAQKAAFLPQSRNIPNITAGRMVLHGRFAYLSYPRRYRKMDLEIARHAMEWADALELENRPVQELSGGQRQKVYLAMALAQDTATIFMDEPTIYLDVAHQLEVMSVVRQIAADGKAVVVVLHDLCLALRTADRIAVLADGVLHALDRPQAVYESGILEQVFGVTVARVQTARGWQYYYDHAVDQVPAGGTA